MTKTLSGYPPLLLLQASHPVQVPHLLHLHSGSWWSSFAFLPIWPFSLGLDFGWKLGRQFLVSALEPFSPQAFLASSFSTLYQGLLKDFAARLSQQDSPPRLDQFVLHTHPQHHHCWPPSPLWQMVPPKAYFLKKCDCQKQSQLDRIFWNIAKFSLLNNNVGMGQTIGYWCYKLTFWTPWFWRWGLVEPLSLQPMILAIFRHSILILFFFLRHSWFVWMIPSVGRITELMDSLSSSDDRIGGFPQQVGCWNCQQVDSLSSSDDRIGGCPQQLGWQNWWMPSAARMPLGSYLVNFGPFDLIFDPLWASSVNFACWDFS